MTSPPTAAAAARSAGSSSRRNLSPRRSRRRRSTRCSARTWRGPKEWTKRWGESSFSTAKDKNILYDYIMILHMMFIIVVQQWVFSYDYIMILHMMIAMFIAHKKNVLRYVWLLRWWLPRVLSTRHQELHIQTSKLASKMSLLVGPPLNRWVGFEASLNSWGVWKSSAGKYRTIEYFFGWQFLKKHMVIPTKKHLVGQKTIQYEQQHAVPNSGTCEKKKKSEILPSKKKETGQFGG